MKKEQIEKKAKKLYPDEHSCKDEFTRQMRQSLIVLFRKCFVEGANWVLSNQWVSVEDELPEYIPNCFVAYKAMDNVLYSTGSYEKDNDEWYVDGFGYNANVTHWMPIPPLAEEGGSDE